MADIVDDFLARILSLAPELSAELARRAEVDIRREWGGNVAYVAKRPSLQRAQAIGQHLQAGATLAQCFEAAGIKRARGYSILNRPLGRPGKLAR